MTDQYAEEKRWALSFDLKEESEDECLTEREEGSSRAQVQCTERISPPGSSSQSYEHGRSEYMRLSEESRDKQLREV